MHFSKIIKNCLYCGNVLKLNNTRDIKRKNFCSRKCSSIYYANKAIGSAWKNREKIVSSMKGKRKTITPAFLVAQRERGLKLRGENHSNWKGGIAYKTRGRYILPEWKQIACKIRQRDNHTCQLCFNSKGNYKICVHHIEPYRVSKDDTEFNLISLCNSCHPIVENSPHIYKPVLKQRIKEIYHVPERF